MKKSLFGSRGTVMAVVAILSRSEPFPKVLRLLRKSLACSTAGEILSMPATLLSLNESGILTSCKGSVSFVFFRGSYFMDTSRGSGEGFVFLKDSDGLDTLRESEIFDNLEEPNGLEVFKVSDIFDDLRESDVFDDLRESDVFDDLRESDSFDVFRGSDSLDDLYDSVPEVSNLSVLRGFVLELGAVRDLFRLDKIGDVGGLSVCNDLFIVSNRR